MSDDNEQVDPQLVEHQLKYCSQILTKLKRNPNIGPFLQPVDPVALGIPDYPEKIKHPMDISTIRKKLDTKVYKRAKEFDEDVKLMLNNCYVYNEEGSTVYNMGKEVDKVYTEAMGQMPQEIPKKRKKVELLANKSKRVVKALDTMKIEDYEFCSDVLTDLTKAKHKKYNWPFLEPVDTNLVADYLSVIKEPMDLHTMREKLDQRKYGDIEEFNRDLRLIVENCFTFNPPGSEVYECGVELEKGINALLHKINPKDISGKIQELKRKVSSYTKEIRSLEAKLSEQNYADPNSPRLYSLNERIDLGNKIINLNRAQAEQIAKIIQKHGVGEYVENDEIEVDLRLLPDNVTEEIDSYVRKVYAGVDEQSSSSNI